MQPVRYERFRAGAHQVEVVAAVQAVQLEYLCRHEAAQEEILVKKSTIIGIAAAAAVLVCAAGGAVWYVRSLQSRSGFLDRTVINGKNVAGKMPAQVAELLSDGFEEGRVLVTEDGKEVFGASLQELGFRFDRQALEESLTQLMESEKKDLLVVLDGVRNGNSFEVALPYQSDPKAFDKAVSVDALSAPRKKNRNAKILFYEEEKECRIRPEVQGTELTDKALRKWLRGEVEAMLAERTGAAKDGQAVYENPEEASGEDAFLGETEETEKELSREEAKNVSDKAGGSAADKALEDVSKKVASEEAVSKKTGAGDDGASEKATAEASVTAAEEAAPAAEAAAAAGAAAKKTAGRNSEGRFDLVCEIPSSLYTEPEKKASDKKLQEKCRILNKYAKETVTYVFGAEKETLEFATFMNWIKVRDGKAKLREEKVREYVEKLIDKYETRYHERVFTTAWGYQVTFSPEWSEYGYTILEEDEIKQLTQDILSGKSVEREPVYLAYNDWGCPLYFGRNGRDDLNGTYVEVSLSAQHMWYYQYGVLVLESDVVTGDVTKGLGTATGVFPLAFKESPSILRGGEGKERYETKVQYWMPFHEGQGLHDATWRSKFGGSIYRGDGSHGCVNLPYWAAEVLYNSIVPGTAIVVYW